MAMSMHSSQAKLQEAMKLLRARWSGTRSHWDDAMSRRFETEFIEPLQKRFREGLGAMEHMNDVLARLEQDCG